MVKLDNVQSGSQLVHNMVVKGKLTPVFWMTIWLDLTVKHAPPLSWSTRLVRPKPASTTKRLPLVSNSIDRGVVSPVATRAIV